MPITQLYQNKDVFYLFDWYNFCDDNINYYFVIPVSRHKIMCVLHDLEDIEDILCDKNNVIGYAMRRQSSISDVVVTNTNDLIEQLKEHFTEKRIFNCLVNKNMKEIIKNIEKNEQCNEHNR
jgi:Na+/phosphate symporter